MVVVEKGGRAEWIRKLNSTLGRGLDVGRGHPHVTPLPRLRQLSLSAASAERRRHCPSGGGNLSRQVAAVSARSPAALATTSDAQGLLRPSNSSSSSLTRAKGSSASWTAWTPDTSSSGTGFQLMAGRCYWDIDSTSHRPGHCQFQWWHHTGSGTNDHSSSHWNTRACNIQALRSCATLRNLIAFVLSRAQSSIIKNRPHLFSSFRSALMPCP